MDYASFIYYPKIKKEKKVLERIQNYCIKLALVYRKSTPNNVSIAESKILLFGERSKLMCCKYLLKSVTNSSNKTAKIINQYFNNKISNSNKKNGVFLKTALRKYTV